jgi:hypothetical protein
LECGRHAFKAHIWLASSQGKKNLAIQLPKTQIWRFKEP